MLNITTDIQPLSQLIQHPDEVVAQVRRTGNPVVLTVDGRANVVVMDAAAFEAMRTDWAIEASVADLQQGIDEFEAGLGRPAREVLAEIFPKHGL